MFKQKIFGIFLVLFLAGAGAAIFNTGCYDDSQARVTIHLERNDLAFNKDIKQKKFIDRVLEFFSTPAEAFSTNWVTTHGLLTLYVTSPYFEDMVYSIPAIATNYSVIVPATTDVTFKIISFVSVKKNWGSYKIVDLVPGEQDFVLNMIPMTEIRQIISGPPPLSITWDETSASTNTLAYKIYRSESINGPYTLIETKSGAGSYTTTDTPPAVGTFYYRISVVSTDGEGLMCDAVSGSRAY